ncbi:HPP family protein [Candidatus Nitrospira bockiana]
MVHRRSFLRGAWAKARGVEAPPDVNQTPTAIVKVAKTHILASALSWIGSLLGLGTVGFIAAKASFPLLIAPFGASAVLLFSAYESPLAQPRNMIFGHALSALIGVAVALIGVQYYGDSHLLHGYLWVASAVATAIFLMQVLHITHPPAGATALLASSTITRYDDAVNFVNLVILGSLILLTVALLFNNLVPQRHYPKRW